MRKLLIVIILVMGVNVLYSNNLKEDIQTKDIIVLNNNMSFQGFGLLRLNLAK